MNNTSHTNIGRSRLSIPLKALSAFLAVVMFFWPVAPVMGRNLPSGWNVVKGQVTVTVNGKTMTVDQATAKAIVNWDSFDVGKGYTVDINQISTKAAMLARVVGANASEILGSLKATGGLYLVNPNGILFGSGAVIDVNRLIASTYDISNDDFWSGNLKFQGDSGASVVNRATINAESAALIGKNVENYGTINASQAALVGAAGPVKLDNFGNGANLSIDFSGLTGAHDTKVVNEGTINAAGGEAILTAEAGKGLVEANNGTVVASSAEFSGKNSAPSNLGNLTADRILLDPEGSIVIGSLQAGGYKGKDGTRYAEYHPKAGGEIPPTFDAPYSSSSNAECTTSNMTVYDKDGNGWTYTYSTEDVTDPLTGATHVQYNYGTPVCTYYNSKYLSGHLQTANWGFSYTSGGGWAGDVTFTRGEGENLEQIMIGGTFGLNLEAERNLGILDYVHFNNPNDIKLQGGNLVIGDFASVEALGNVSIIANTALANTGRLDITTPKRVELFINGGEAAFGTLNITSFEDDIFLRTSNLNVAGKLMLNAKHDIYATGEDMKAGNVNFTANAGDVNVDAPVTTKWMVLAAGRDVQINGAANTQSNIHITAGRDAVSTGALDVAEGAMTITAGRDATLAKLSTAHPDDYLSDVKVTAKNTVTLNGEVTGGRLWATATEGDVVIKAPVTVDMRVGATAGRDVISTADLTATDGFIEIIAGRDATLARLAAGPTSSVDVNAGNDVTLNGTVDAWFVIIDAKNNATLNDDVTGGERVHASAAEGDLVVNGDVTANGTFVELLAGRDAEINGNINATNGLYGKATITAKNNATINGTIKAGGVAATATEGDLLIAGDVTSTRNIHDDATTFTAGRDVKIDGSVTSAGWKNATIITAGRDIIATADIANADESITATAGRDVEFAKLTAENGDLTVTAKDNATFNGAVSANAVAITAAEGDLVVKGAVAANDGSGKFVAGQDVKIVKDGNVSAKGDLTVEAGRDITSESDIASTEGKVALDAKNAISVEGEVSAAGNVDLMATDGNVKVTKAITSTDEGVTIKAGHDVDVKDVSAGRALAINAGQDVDTGALTAGNGTLLVAAARNITVGDISATSDDVPSVVLINSENGSVRTEGINVGGNAYVTGKGDVTTNGAVNADRSVVIGSFEGNVEVKGATGKDVTIKAVTGNVVADNVTANGADGADPALRITAGRDIEAGSLEATDGTVSVEAKNNALIDGDVSANTVAITAIEGELVVKAPVTSTVEGVTLAAGQDAQLAGAVTAEKDAAITAGRDIAATADVTSNNGNIAAAAGRDASFAKLIAENGEVTVNAKNSATLGAINTQNVNVFATDGDITLTEDLTAKGINLAANSGNVTTEALTATETDISVNAGVDAAFGDLEAKGMVLVTAKNNATLKGTATGLAVSVTATEGDLKVNAPVMSTEDLVVLNAGRDVKTTAAVTAEGDMLITAGRDISADDELKSNKYSVIAVAGRDAKLSRTTAEGDVIVEANSNVKLNGDVDASNIYVTAKEESLESNGVLTANGAIELFAGTHAYINNDVTGGNVRAITINNMFVDGNIEATDADIFLMSNRNAWINGTLKANTDVHVDAIDSLDVFNTVDAVTGSVMLNANNSLQAQGTVTAAGDVSMTTDLGNLDVYGDVKAGEMASFGSNYGNVAVYGDVEADYIVASTTNGNASVSGNLTAEDSVTVQAGLDAKVDGDVVAKGDFIRVTGGRDVSTSNLTAENGGIKVIAGNNADLSNAAKAKEISVEATAGTIASVGTLEATDGDITLKAGKDVNYLHANASGNITADAGRDIRAYGPTTAGGDVKLTARGNLMSNDNGVIDAEGDAKLVAKDGDVTLKKATVNAKNVTIEAGHDVTTLAEVTAEAGDVTVTAGRDAALAKLTAESGDVTVTAKGNATFNGAVNATTVTATATEGDVNVKAPVTATEDDVILTARRDVVIDGGVVVAERDVLLTATDGTVYIGETVTANTGNVQATAGKVVNVDASVEATEGDVNFKAASDVYIFDPVKAGKTIDIISLKGDVYTSKYGDLTAENGFIMVSALSGNVELAGDATAENGDVIINAGKDIDIHAPSNILAQNVDMTTAHGDVSNDGSIAAKGLEDSTVMVNANGNIRNTGSIQADKAVQLISTKDIRNTGSIQAGTATEKPLTPGSVIEFNADGKATSTGSLVAETITGLAADDITITGELNTDYLNLKTTGSDGDITVETEHDIIAASLVTEGDQSDISFKGKNVDEMTAETKGTDADIDIKGGKMTIRKAVTFDGDVDIAGSGDLVLDVVEAKDGGKYTGPDKGEARHVNVTSGGMVKILTHVKADADVNIDARGPILDTDYAVITSGGDTSLTSGAYIGDVADGNPIHVEAEGTIYVNPRPGTPKVEYFAFIEGTSGDGQIHTKASSLPGLVIFNSVPWMGTKKQMGRLDRSYAEKFSAINGMLEVFNLSYPLVAEYRYFPHTILDLDGFTNAPRKGIEIIRMGGEKGGTINGLPEGLTPRNIPSVSDYEWTFLWPLDNEDADNAAEPVEATVSER